MAKANGKSEQAIKVSKARANLALRDPFFGSLGLKLEPTEDPTCKTMWTDGKRLGFSPRFVDALTFDELKGVLVHEVLHCLLSHMARRGERKHRRWNVACDYAINHLVAEAGYKLPEGGLRDPSFDGKAAEQIYTLIPEDPEGNGSQPGSLRGGGNGRGDDQGHSDAPGDPGGCGEVRDAKNGNGGTATGPEADAIQGDWKVAATQAAALARKAGKLPGCIDQLIQEIVEPDIPVNEVIARFVAEVCRNDYSWQRPNPRYAPQGVYVPSLYNLEVGNVALIVDTSGSITDQDLNLVAGVLQQCLAYYHTGFKVLYVDHAFQAEEDFEPDSPIRLHAKGRGGTSFVPGFDHLKETGITPSAVLYVTDGYSNDFPEEIPNYPVIWLLNQRNPDFVPPFGETVLIKLS